MSKSATKKPKRQKPRKPKDGWSKMPWFKLLEKFAKDEAAIQQMTNDEFFEISRMLEDCHSIFYKFWEVGKPHFTRRAKSAAIAFNRKTGHYVGFIFHPEFWNWLGEDVPNEYYSRLFVIGHEMLHIILRHGLRTKDCEDNDLANTCLDIVINHLLVDRFGFDRAKVKGADDLCWIDTVFLKNPFYTGPDVEKDKAFEYYYLLAKKHLPQVPVGGKGGKGGGGKGGGGRGLPELVDEHDGLSPEEVDELLDEMNEILSDEEKEDLRDVLEDHCENDDGGPDGDKDSDDKDGGGKGGKRAGCGSGGVWTFADTSGRVKKKRKWETVIKKWALHKIAQVTRDFEQWARIARRFAAVEQQLGDMSLPSEMEVDDTFLEQDRIEVWFYQDTSGSCVHLVERFFKAARSLPTDRFKIRLFAFNDNVYEADMETGKLNLGGGTNFAILEAEIQKRMKSESIKYPDAIFVITDGCGTAINPAKPERWYWFLSEKHEGCIPDKCHRFMLRDFE